MTRREFLGAIGRPAALGAVAAFDPLGVHAALAKAAAYSGSAAEAAGDEAFWFEMQQAFTVDRSVVNLNNAGVSPSPAVVQAAQRRHLDFASSMPPPVALWEVQEPQRETVRQRLARTFGADGEEIALVRNSSEGLEICQQGFDLRRGDEVLATNQDYPRMIAAFEQRARREGIVLPVRKVVELGRERGIPVIVDGAQSFAHLDFNHADLGCDYF